MKKPSKIKVIKAKKAHLLLPTFRTITLFGVAYCNKKKDVESINASDEIDSTLKSHETIHVRQAESTKNSWFLFYLKYAWQWLCNLSLMFVNLHAPYKFIPFELEAYLNQDDWDYCLKGAATQWKEFKKIPLKKRRKWAKEYFKANPKPYFTYFIRGKINED